MATIQHYPQLGSPPPYNPELDIKYPEIDLEGPDSNPILYPTNVPISSSFNQIHTNLYHELPVAQEAPIYNPIEYRQPHVRMVPYQFSQSAMGPIFPKEELNTLQNHLLQHIAGFDPWNIEEEHPIHSELVRICGKLLGSCKHWPLHAKISYLKNGVAELTMGCGHFANAQLTNLEKLPQFELLEIALRRNLYEGLLYQEKSAIESFCFQEMKFPGNLNEIEASLHHFVTKNNFYFPPNCNMYQMLIEEVAHPHALCCIKKTNTSLSAPAFEANEKWIKDCLEPLQLSKPSQCSTQFEGIIRNGMTKKMMTPLAVQYREQFQKTGTLDISQMKANITQLHNFNTSNGKLPSYNNIYFHLLNEIFELPQNDAPFVSVRAKILQESSDKIDEIINSAPAHHHKRFLWVVPVPFTSTRRESKKLQHELEGLTLKKLRTIDAIEKEWNNFYFPQEVIPSIQQFQPSLLQVASAPLLDEPLELPPTHLPQQLPKPPEQQATVPAKIIEPVAPVVVPQTPKFSVKNPNTPVISYVDISFEELLKKGSDQDKWGSLPPVVQKDVLLHVHYRPSLKGKAEEIALRVFNNDGWKIQQKVGNLNQSDIPSPETGLSKDFVSAGQSLIDLYYSDKIVGQFHTFIDQFRALPKEQRFYRYVYEMAKAANVQIESWDHNFAENNWDQPGILNLSVQALERCLHTAP
jgi:hypothetical protein